MYIFADEIDTETDDEAKEAEYARKGPCNGYIGESMETVVARRNGHYGISALPFPTEGIAELSRANASFPLVVDISP